MIASQANQPETDEKEIFLRALEIEDVGRRADYLDEACGADEKVRIRVERLLSLNSQREGDILDAVSRENLEIERGQLAVELAKEDTFLDELGSGEIKRIGDYDLLDEIGRGAMGVVYRARQRSLSREVALKIILGSSLVSDAERERFRVEAESAARLNHANIVPIYEVGHHDDCDYYSMALIKGGTLGDRMKGDSLERREAVALVATVARAIHAAHRQGIIHRDLKPDNILIDEEGDPHIGDFGLACRFEQNSTLTLSGQIMGTPQYMAPEQADATVAPITIVADVYGIGSILYELLTGAPAFRGDSVLQTLRLVKEEPPKPLRQRDPSIDRDLETMVLRCLEKKPADRYPSAEALAMDLEAWLDHRPIAARRPGTMERAAKWARRRPVHAALLGTVILFLLVLGIGGPINALHQANLRNDAELARKDTDKALQKAEKAHNDALEQLARNEQLLYANDMRDIPDAIATDQTQNFSPFRRLNSWNGSKKKHLRDWEWFYLASLAHHRPVAHGGHVPLIRANLKINPAGDLVAVQSQQFKHTFVRDTHIGLMRHIVDKQRDRPHRALAWNGSGDRIAIVSNSGEAMIFSTDGWDGWEADAANRLFRFRDASDLLEIDWCHHTGDLAIYRADNVLEIWAAPNRKDFDLRKAVLLDTPELLKLAWSPDGTHLAGIGKSREAYIWKTDEIARDPVVLKGHERWILGLAWKPDGSTIATSDRDGRIFLWNREGTRTHQLIGHEGSVKDLVWKPDGSALLSCGMDGTIRVWDPVTSTNEIMLEVDEGIIAIDWSAKDEAIAIMRESGRFEIHRSHTPSPSRRLVESDSPIGAVLWSPDGQFLSYAGEGGIQILDARTEAFEPVFETLRPGVFHAWNPKKGQFATLTAMGKLRIADTDDWVFSEPRRICDAPPLGLAWSPDGTRLATLESDRSINIWDDEGQELVGELRDKDGPTEIRGMRWHPDSRHIMVYGDPVYYRGWDTKTGKSVFNNVLIFKDTMSGTLEWHPHDGSYAAGNSAGEIHIWEWPKRSGRKEIFAHSGPIRALAWHPDGNRLASGGPDGEVRIWNHRLNEWTLKFEEQSGPVTSLAWSPDGQRLVSSSEDGTIWLWDASWGYETEDHRD
ncbi:MAG: protein kinase [Verrucomicrobiota bacterium]